MSPFKDLLKRMQESMDELGDTLSGTSTAERLLDADIRQLDAQLHGWRGEVASLKARRITSGERLRELGARIRQLEADALNALRARRKTAARELAEAIAAAQAAKAGEKTRMDDLQAHEKALLHVIEQGESKLRRLKHQLDTLRASESLQRAQAAVAKRQPDATPHPESAVASAQRVRQRRTPGSTSSARTAASAKPPAEAILDRLAARLGAADSAASPPARKPARRRS